MALSIQSNAAATTIRNQLNRTNDGLSVALERLGTGFRINSAKDDAAGLQIATRLSAQLVGQDTAISNTSNCSRNRPSGELACRAPAPALTICCAGAGRDTPA